MLAREVSQPPKGTQSIHRTISVIRAISQAKKCSRLSWIARKTNLPLATTHRILSGLEWNGLINHDPYSKEYSLGDELFYLVNAACQSNIRERLRSSLERVANETEDMVFLQIRSAYDVLCADLVTGGYPIRAIAIKTGTRRPLGIGAGGLALIAFLPDEKFEEIIRANQQRYLQYYKIKPDYIRYLANVSRKRGYVVSEQVFQKNITSVSVPLFDRNKNVMAAISVASIPQRMNKERQKKVAQIINKTIEIEGTDKW